MDAITAAGVVLIKVLIAYFSFALLAGFAAVIACAIFFYRFLRLTPQWNQEPEWVR